MSRRNRGPIGDDEVAIETVTQSFQRLLGEIDDPDEAAALTADYAAYIAKDENDRICVLKRELNNVCRVNEDLLRKQNAFQEQIEKVKKDENIFSKLLALMKQFEELASIKINAWTMLRSMSTKVMVEIDYTAIQLGISPIGEGPSPVRHQALAPPLAKTDEFFLEKKYLTVGMKYMGRAMSEIGKLDEIEEKSTISLLHIKTLVESTEANENDMTE